MDELEILKEREACAQMLELRNSELLLMVGQMTAQELRTVKAVLAQLADAIRMRSNASFTGSDAAGGWSGGSASYP